MEWKTKISKITDEGVIVRGENLYDLMENKSFTEVIFLTLQGRLPNQNERKLLDAILVSSIIHSVGVGSITTARIISSMGNKFSTSVAGGILAIGDYHGGAIEHCAKLLQSNKSAKEIVKEALENKMRLPGLGHKVYKEEDPRTTKLFSIAQSLGIATKYIKLLKEIQSELKEQKGKFLVINVDGAIAACISDLGFSWEMANSFFIIPRTVGICAHVHEELSEPPVRRVPESEIIYEGK